MMIDLNSWETKLVLEALRTLEAEWTAKIDSTDDEDIQSEYGNDLAQLEMTHERIGALAREEFGLGVSTFSRKPIGVTPKL